MNKKLLPLCFLLIFGLTPFVALCQTNDQELFYHTPGKTPPATHQRIATQTSLPSIGSIPHIPDSLNKDNTLSEKEACFYKKLIERGYSTSEVKNLILVHHPTYKGMVGNPSLLATGPEQNCPAAIPVCQSTYTQNTSYTGYGYQEVKNGTCLGSNETNSVWYVFTVQPGGSGSLNFTLSTTHDYDWALYDITAIGCAGVPTASPVRCNYSATYGNTGMSNTAPAPGPGINPSEPASGIPWSTELAVTAGQTYALIVDNYSSDLNGYTLTFATGGGYASIYDITAPTISSVVSNCGTTLTLNMSEQVKCTTIDANGSDFAITGPAAMTVSAASGTGCSGASTITNQILLTVSTPATTGTYTLTPQSGGDGNSVWDKCNNSLAAAITFPYLGTITLTTATPTICTSGTAVTLTAGGANAGGTYTLNPGNLSNTTGTFTVNPTATTAYTVSVTYAGCTKTASTTVTLLNNVVVTITPDNPTICAAGTATLTASSSVNGVVCGACTYQWSGSSAATTSVITGGAGTYSCVATSGSCPSNTAVSVVSLASGGAGGNCNIYFVSPAGGGTGLTKASPTDLVTALSLSTCQAAVIEMQTGVYNFSNSISVNSFVTIEGGYNTTFTQKTSDMSSGGSTRIIRSSTPDGGAGTNVTLFNVAGSASGFRFQDLRLEMPSGYAAGSHMTNYAIYLGAGCSSYNIVRCYIDAGTGASGTNGTNGTNGNSGSTASDVGGTAGTSGGTVAGGNNGGNGGNGFSSCQTNGSLGTDGGGNPGSKGAAGSAGGFGSGSCIFNSALNGVAGVNGTDGGNGTSGTASYSGGYFVSADGTNGTSGTNGTGGGGGGGSGTNNYYGNGAGCVPGSGGAGGGAGGTGATAGTAGTGAGSAFGIFSVAKGAGGVVTQCQIAAVAGTAGSGGSASSGGSRGLGGSAFCFGGSSGNDGYNGGNGGNGGRGGNGGSGGNGAAGASCLVCDITSPTGPLVNAGYSSFSLTGQQIIQSGDGTNNYTNCTNTNMNMVSAAPSPDWTGSAAPLTGAGTPVTTAYTTTGRKTVSLGSNSGVTKTVYVQESFEGAFLPAGWATNTNGSGNPWTQHNGYVAYDQTYYAACVYNATQPSTGYLYTPGIAMTAGNTYYMDFWQEIADNTYTEKLAVKIGNAQTPAAQTTTLVDYGTVSNIAWVKHQVSYTPGSSGTFYFSFYCYSPTNQLEVLVDSVTAWGISPATVTNSYTDFNNMMISPPSTGSITGVTNVCPGTYAFASSTAGATGMLYSWSVNTVSGNTPSIASATSSSTNITFPNTTAGALTFTVTCTITSECCGQLPPVTYTVVVNPYPAAPTASAASGTPCPGTSDVLTATAPAGATYTWYTLAAGGVQLGTGSTYTVNPVVLGSTNYYLSATNSSGCVSLSRTAVNVTGTATAAPAATGGSACGAATITLYISSPVSGYIYSWYSSCGGSLLQASTSTAYAATVASTTIFYVTATAPGGCNESACTSVTATIGAAPNPINWLGAVGGLNNWYNTANWTSGCLPTCADNVVIPVTANNPDIGLGTNPAACKDFTLNSGATLSFSDAKAEFDICGNTIHSGTLTSNSKGKVVFMGTTAQTYARTGTGSFNNVALNNTAGIPSLTLNNDMTLNTTGSFSFLSGMLNTGANNLIITNTSPSAMSGYVSTMYVYGNLKRSILSTGSYDFPVGDALLSKGYQLANINFTAATNVTTLLCRFDQWGGAYPLNAQGGTDAACFASYLSNDLDNGYWSFTADVNPSTGNYTATLNSTNYTNSSLGVYWTVTKYPTLGAGWILDGSCVAPYGVPSFVQRTGMNSFSKFAVAQSISALPIDMLSFTGKNLNHVNYLNWETATETNNDHFEVQRSADGNTFQLIGKVNGAGTSSQIHYYSFNDQPAPAGLSYYRIKQVDLNGAFSYSNIVALTDVQNQVIVENLYPNPTSKDMNFDFITTTKGLLTVDICDVLGRIVLSEVKSVSEGRNNLTARMSELSTGTYYMKIRFNGTGYQSVHKVIKE
jgi:hypothetical protein